MGKRSVHHRSRYDVLGNVEAEYVDPDQTVLTNKIGATDLATLQVAEEAALLRAYEALLEEVRTDTPMSCDLLLRIHHRIFGGLYAWAGRWRTVTISKPGVIWPPPVFIPTAMDEFERALLQAFPPSELTDDQRFCEAIAAIQGEFLVVHPFREGNARTIKLMSDLLAAQTGRPLLVYDQTESGQKQYIFAASQAFAKNYEPLRAIIQVALDCGMRQ